MSNAIGGIAKQTFEVRGSIRSVWKVKRVQAESADAAKKLAHDDAMRVAEIEIAKPKN